MYINRPPPYLEVAGEDGNGIVSRVHFTLLTSNITDGCNAIHKCKGKLVIIDNYICYYKHRCHHSCLNWLS